MGFRILGLLGLLGSSVDEGIGAKSMGKSSQSAINRWHV